MKLYFYPNLNGEDVPKDITHVIISETATKIRKRAFESCRQLISVVMGDSIISIEEGAFMNCHALKVVQLSRTLECVKEKAFYCCWSLEILCLPITLRIIGRWAFRYCRSFRLMILPLHFDLSSCCEKILSESSALYHIATAAGAQYEWDYGKECENGDDYEATGESKRRVHGWLIHHLDKSPFNKLCFDPFVTTKKITTYLEENGRGSALQVDPEHKMTPLHMLTLNPHASAAAIGALLEANFEAVFCSDLKKQTPLDNARKYNMGGLIAIVGALSIFKDSPL